MSTAVTDSMGTAPTGTTPTSTTTAGSRIGALGRAELILLGRNKATLFMAFVMPVFLTFSFKSAAEKMDLAGTGLSTGTVLLPASIGLVLLFAVYGNLTTAYVARREELVLKRLRTGELNDLEILSGTALASVAIGVAQIVLIAIGGVLLLGVEMPKQVWWTVIGVALGLVMMVAMAAISSVYAKTVETAGLITLPLMLGSTFASGMVVPLEVMPELAADIMQFLPVTPVVDLVRNGFTGLDGTGDSLRQIGVAVAWILLAVFAVQRKFRWEPRH